jgi:hypothetical protein
LLSFAYVYFLESGLFNALRPIQIKKSFPLSAAARDDPSEQIASITLPLLFAAGRLASYLANGNL